MIRVLVGWSELASVTDVGETLPGIHMLVCQRYLEK